MDWLREIGMAGLGKAELVRPGKSRTVTACDGGNGAEWHAFGLARLGEFGQFRV